MDNSKIIDLLNKLDDYLVNLFEASLKGLVNERDSFSDDEYLAVHALFVSCRETEKSVMMLLRNRLVFDADALLRSVAEGSVRILYMLSGPREGVHEKIKEYVESLPLEVQKNLKKRAVSVVDQKEGSTDEYREILSQFEGVETSGTPNEIGGRWSFSGLFKELKGELWGAVRLSRIQIAYALQSDLLHKGYLTCQLRQELGGDDVGVMTRIMFSLYDLADMRCQVISGQSAASSLCEKHGAVVCGILAMNGSVESQEAGVGNEPVGTNS